MYGPERRGAPVASYVRVSSEPIEERGYIASPDAVVILDTSLVDLPSADPLGGRSRNTVVICNTTKCDETLERNRVNIDVSGLAKRVLGRDNISAGIAAVTCKALGLARVESVLEAVKTEAVSIGLNEELVAKNMELVRECFAATPRVEADSPQEPERNATELFEMRYAWPTASTAQIKSTGNSHLKKMGLWRASTPVIDYSRCTKCMICFVYCPDSCVTLDDDLTPRIDYDNCKGCMICMVECPLRAIREEVVR
jgi:pyruvate ferredoxin oxidoreductase gamma subunit